MKKKKIQIAISAEAGTGKSYLTFLIKKMLRENGFEVNFTPPKDFGPTEADFDTRVQKVYNNAILPYDIQPRNTALIDIQQIELAFPDRETEYRIRVVQRPGEDFKRYYPEVRDYVFNCNWRSVYLIILDPYFKNEIDAKEEIERYIKRRTQFTKEFNKELEELDAYTEKTIDIAA